MVNTFCYSGTVKDSRKKQSKSTKTRTGEISLSARGVGYIADPENDADIEIQPESRNSAQHGDTVEIVLEGKIRGRTQGRVVKVTHRARNTFVGTVEKGSNGLILKADSRKMSDSISLSLPHNAKVGDKVAVKISQWKTSSGNPTGEITRAIGKSGTHNAEMEAIVFEGGFEIDFSKQVEEEANGIKARQSEIMKEEEKTRRDMRGVTTFTIDPADAKDFDDAISLKTLSNGDTEIGVHIADVSFYVREGTELDKEALKRSLSVYLVDRTIPMLPEVLSNDLCSLNPHTDKLAYSAIFKINSSGKVYDRWFGRTIIHSDKRFSYEDAQEVLNKKSGDYSTELTTLNALAKNMQRERHKNGAIDFGDDEVKFVLDEDGKPIDVVRRIRTDSHKLVEEFMLLANREVATYFYNLHQKNKTRENSLPLIYRVHDIPDAERVANLAVFVRALGFELPADTENLSAKDINALLERVQGDAREQLIKTAALRTMAKAIYTTKNTVGHFGLSFKYYAHFTSPIRRYPDLVVHRMLDLCQKKLKFDSGLWRKLEDIAIRASEQEKKAVDAERASIKYKQVEYMSDHIGEEFQGTITGVTEWGVYVAEDNSKSEGMIKVRDLPDDYYNLDQKNYALVGERTKRMFTLGDTVHMKVAGASLEQRTIDYVLVE